MEYVESIGLANVRDIGKMLRWNEKYGIRFMRLSSEIFPFASHQVRLAGLWWAIRYLSSCQHFSLTGCVVDCTGVWL